MMSDCFIWDVQNPVTTALWLVTCCQIITPMFSFSVDCALFCKSESRPDVIVEAVYVIIVSIGCLLGPYYMFQGHGSFYDLPFEYRYKAYAVNVSGAVTYAVALKCTRLILSRHQRRVAALSSS
jgi:Mn2+/Fe2+ NRAMP family transporter